MSWPNNVTKADLKIGFFRAGGPGGQNQNKRDSACRITHIPTGISAESREYKQQAKNKSAAFKKLANKLIPLMKASLESPEETKEITDRIRTYNEKRGEVKDHRTGVTQDFQKTLNGELDPFIEAGLEAIHNFEKKLDV